MKILVVCTVTLIGICGLAGADGKFYIPDAAVPETPYQRAFIKYSDGVQLLILQSQYLLQHTMEDVELGWIVPVPAEPELASMPASEASDFFIELAFRSRPRVTFVKPWLMRLALFAAVVFFVCSLCLWLAFMVSLAFTPGTRQYTRTHAIIKWLPVCSFIILLAVLAFLYVYVRNFYAGSRMEEAGVDVLREERVGVFDVKVIASDSPDALLAWLQAHAFHFEAADRSAFETYVDSGWCFVVARLAPDVDTESREVVDRGLAAPLILRFPSEQPVYPLALTGTGGFDTEVLIYLATEKSVLCDDDRLALRYAGPGPRGDLTAFLLANCEPEGFIQAHKIEDLQLTKYHAVLTAEEMGTDVTFSLTDEEIAYREHMFRW